MLHMAADAGEGHVSASQNVVAQHLRTGGGRGESGANRDTRHEPTANCRMRPVA